LEAAISGRKQHSISVEATKLPGLGLRRLDL
jgi:hypothetical protein